MKYALAAVVLFALSGTAHAEQCIASVYGTKDHDQNGTRTASGIPLKDSVASIAHKTLPLKSRAWVVNRRTGQGDCFPVTDRGPYFGDRCVDLSQKAARKIGCPVNGLCEVTVGSCG